MDLGSVPREVRRQRLEEWISEYGDAVLRTCYIYLADRGLAEDALQDTFLKAWRSMDHFEGRNGCSAKTWIIRIAINTCKNYRGSAWHRRVDRSKIVEELQIAGDDGNGSRELFLAVVDLPEKLRQVVILYYYHDMSMAEIGEILRVSRSAIQHRLQKAHALLREYLDGSD